MVLCGFSGGQAGSSRVTDPAVAVDHLRHAGVPEVRLQRVVADPENPARPPFVALASADDELRVAAAPGAHGVVARDRWEQSRRVVPPNRCREIVELDIVGLAQRDGPLDQALEFTDIP